MIPIPAAIRLVRWLMAASLAATLASRTLAADFLVELDLMKPEAGGAITIHVVGLNPAATPDTRVFPATVAATLITGHAHDPIQFHPVTPLPAEGVVVAPGGFARISYSAPVPERAQGSARLVIELSGAPSFAIEIAAAAGAAASGAAPPMLSMKEAMDRETTETSFFKRHIFPYEPFYFIAGPDAPSAKFQVSIKYRLVNTQLDESGKGEGWLYRNANWMDGLHLAYTQRSLWDIQAESAPFLDSSYMPELLYERPNLIDPEHGWLERIGAQIGYQHESNGKDGASSRSLNIAYLRMPFVFGDEDNFYVSLEPRAWFYVGNLPDNPDLTDYRGYVDLRLKAGWARGLQVAAWARAGQDFNRGSAQVDVTYPLHNLLSRSFSLYLQAQYFNGYGESLLYYNEHSETWRVGIGLFR